MLTTKKYGLGLPLAAGAVTAYTMDTVYTNLPRSLHWIKCYPYSRQVFTFVPAAVVTYRMAK